MPGSVFPDDAHVCLPRLARCVLRLRRDDGRTGENLAFGDFVVFRDCCDNGNVDHGHGGFDGFRWCRRVDDDACRTLHFSHHGQLGHTRTGGGASSDAYEKWHFVPQ